MSWPIAQLGEHVEIVSGFAFKSDQFNAERQGLPLVRIRDVMRGWSETYYDGDADEHFIVNDGDILIGMDGEFNVAQWSGGKALLNQRVCRIISKSEKLVPAYLLRFLPAALKKIEDRTPFVTVKHLSAKDIRSILIPLPPLDEQFRIATILDQADALRRKRREALKLLDDLPLSFFQERFGDPVKNPKKIPNGSLGEVAQLGSGGTPTKSVAKYWNGSFPWVSPKDMKRLRIVEAEDTISETVFAETNLKRIPPGTPLIVVRGMILAHTVPIAMAELELAINQDMKSIHFDNRVLPEFGLWCLKAQHQSLLTKIDTAAHGTKRLDSDVLKQAPILLPPLKEQKLFSAQIYKWERLRKSFDVQSHTIDSLFISLQHRAFREEL